MRRREHTGGGDGESMRTIIIALLANIAVAIVKAIAGILTASAGLLAEAAHSVGDCTTELFLVTAVRRSAKPADRRHPFGYGKERYFWSLLAALTIFAIGAGFSVYQGVSTITGGETGAARPTLGYIVIGVSFVVEAISLRQATGQARTASRRADMSVTDYVRDPDDPTVKSVVLEDSAALVGLGIAGTGLLLRQWTGQDVWDGIAALLIAGLLIVVAFELARTNVGLLIGRQANPRMVDDIRACLDEQPEVLSVIDVLTMMIGTGRVLVCARVDYVDGISATDAERACLRIHDVLNERFGDIEDIFIEPIPRSDNPLTGRAQARDSATDQT